MAQFFKRRGPSGPNKNEQRVQRGKEAERRSRMTGALGQRYPTVERLAVDLDFTGPQGQSLERKTWAFGLNDAVDLAAPCPGRCGEGKFDLAAKIEAVIEARQALSEAAGKCQEPLYSGSTEVCGCQLKCRIEVRYLPLPVVPEPAAPEAAGPAPAGPETA